MILRLLFWLVFGWRRASVVRYHDVDVPHAPAADAIRQCPICDRPAGDTATELCWACGEVLVPAR